MSVLDRLLADPFRDTSDDEKESVTELTDVVLDELSLVSAPATGRRFKVYKAMDLMKSTRTAIKRRHGALISQRISAGRDASATMRPRSRLLRSLTAGG